MKIKSFVRLGIVIMATGLLSCDLFKSKSATVNPLVGKWKLDSIQANDSGDASLAYLLFAMASQDSGKIFFEVTKDSLLTREGATVTERLGYKLDTVKKQLLVSDSLPQVYQYHLSKDSFLTLTDKDSVSLFLKKQ